MPGNFASFGTNAYIAQLFFENLLAASHGRLSIQDMMSILFRMPTALLAALLLFPFLLAPILLVSSPGEAAISPSTAGVVPAQRQLPDPMDVGRAVAGRLDGDGPLDVGGYLFDREQVRRFYERRDFSPAWMGRGDHGEELSAALARAGEEGIELPHAKAGSDPVPAADPAGRQAERELFLTGSAIRYATALAVGRVRPESLEEDWAIPVPAFEAVAGLEHALRGKSGALTKWFANLAPADARYLRLKGALARYRELAASGGWERIPVAGPSIKPGMSDERIPAIRRRLMAEGDMPADADAAAAAVAAAVGGAAVDSLDPVLEKGVRAFQRRHGISEDGTIGQGTLAAFNVSVKSRIEQIIVNLERWRSLPRHFGRDYVFVNVPAESLDVIENGETVMTMKAVVGDPGHPTPVVQASLAGITINPVWNVPTSIALKEILPKAQRDARYLDRNHIRAYGINSFVQKAGPLNPLGQIKFNIPNRFDVYLHDTPSRRAFERAARAMSHGCVRLERARDLAAYVLDPGLWNSEAIDRAIGSGQTQKLDIARHLRVHILYFTGFVDGDGTIEFRDDIYGRDKRLENALEAVTEAHLLAAPQIPKGAPKSKERAG